MHPVNESIAQLLKDTIFALLSWGGDKYKKRKDKKEAEAKQKKLEDKAEIKANAKAAIAAKAQAEREDARDQAYMKAISQVQSSFLDAIEQLNEKVGALGQQMLDLAKIVIPAAAAATGVANAKIPETPKVPPVEVQQPASAEELKTPVNLNKPYVYVAPKDAVFVDVPRAALPASVPPTVEDLLTGKNSGKSPEEKHVNNLGRPLDKNKSPAVLTGTYIPADEQPTPEARPSSKPATITLDKTQYTVVDPNKKAPAPASAQHPTTNSIAGNKQIGGILTHNGNSPEQTHVNGLLAKLGAAKTANPAGHPPRYKVLSKNEEGVARPPVAPATRNPSLAPKG